MKCFGIITVVFAVFIGAATQAEVVIETVTVGNPGNAGQNSGESEPGGHGDDRICGAVDYVYNIGTFEVTAGQYTEFLNAVAATDTYGLFNTEMGRSYGCRIQRSAASPYTYSVTADRANRPVNYVSYWDSCRFANWLHNGQPTGVQSAGTTETGAYTLDGYNGNDGREIQRDAGWTWAVTSEDEWYKAAYHYNDGVTGNYYDYPTGSDSVPGYVNDSVNHSGDSTPFVEGGVDPGNYAMYNGDEGTYGIGNPYYRTVVGEWENSDSPYGTFDQGGNVWEWNESVVDEGGGFSTRGLRGANYSNFNSPIHLHASYRFSYVPTNEASIHGFRVALVPEPATLTLLGVGGLLVARRRRN